MVESPDEIWKQIPFAPDYSVSNHGRIKRVTPGVNGRSDYLLTPRKWGPLKNYLGVTLCADGGKRSISVHRAVAFAFLGGPKGGADQVAHNNGNPANNHLSNLRWSTRAENMADCIKHGTKRQGEKVNTAKLTEDDVRAIRSFPGKHGLMAERYGVTIENISAIRRRLTWKHVVQQSEAA